MLYDILINKESYSLTFKFILMYFLINSKQFADDSMQSTSNILQNNGLDCTVLRQLGACTMNSEETKPQETETTINEVNTNSQDQQEQISIGKYEQTENENCPICLEEYNNSNKSKFLFYSSISDIFFPICKECVPKYIKNPLICKKSENDKTNIEGCSKFKVEKKRNNNTDLINKHDINNKIFPTNNTMRNTNTENQQVESRKNNIVVTYSDPENILDDLICFCTNNSIVLSDELSVTRIKSQDFFLFMKYSNLLLDEIEAYKVNTFKILNNTNIKQFFQALDISLNRNIVWNTNDYFKRVEIAVTDLFQEHFIRILNFFPIFWVILNIKDAYQKLELSNTQNSENIHKTNKKIKILQIKVDPQRISDIIKIFSNIQFSSLEYLNIENVNLTRINNTILDLNIKQYMFLWDIQRIDIIDFNINSLYTLLNILLKIYSKRESIKLTVVLKKQPQTFTEFNSSIHHQISLAHTRKMNDKKTKFQLFFILRTGTSFNKSTKILFLLIEPLNNDSYLIIIDEKTSWDSNYNLSLIKSRDIEIINKSAKFIKDGDCKILIHMMQLNIISFFSYDNIQITIQNQIFTKFDIKKSNLKILSLINNDICWNGSKNMYNFINGFDTIERLAIFSVLNIDLETINNYKKENLRIIENVTLVALSLSEKIVGLPLVLPFILKFINNIKSMKILFLYLYFHLSNCYRINNRLLWNFDSIILKYIEIIIIWQEEDIKNRKYMRNFYNTIKQLKENNKKLKHIILTRSLEDIYFITQNNNNYTLENDQLGDSVYYERLSNSKNITEYRKLFELKNQEGKEILKIVDSIVVEKKKLKR